MCAVLRAPALPTGGHGRKRRQDSNYSTRLKEKQRPRAQYDISETQLRAAFDRAERSGGTTGEALIQDLESRLDATVLLVVEYYSR